MNSSNVSAEPYARSHRMLLYLLMALVLLTLADVSAYYTVIVFLLFLWSDNGDTVVPFRKAGKSAAWVALRTLVDIIPLTAAVFLVWLLSPAPVISGLLLLVGLGFYLASRHRLGVEARKLSSQEGEKEEKADV